ncbi:MAG: YdbH domain-containing protein [Nitrospirota bacterium]|nr:YdbH domain-containing protein [Nitrospirota bacterium]
MTFLKFLGWSIVGFVFLAGLVYWVLPTIGKTLITQGLTNRGFTHVEITIDRPTTHALTISSLSFRTPAESGSTSISIDNTEITYSLDSLVNRSVDAVNIEHMTIAWNSSLFERSSPSAPSFPTPQPDAPFDLTWLRSEPILPVLPFRHLHVTQLDISNPLAPPALQQTSITAHINSFPEGYDGAVQLTGNSLPLDLLTFSFTEDGMISLSGTRTDLTEDPVLYLETSLDRSSAPLMLKGQITLKLHPFIQTLAAVYPIPSQYQSITGTFSGTWTGSFLENPSPSGSSLGPIQGDFTLEGNLPIWPPFVQDIQLLTQGTFSVDEREIAIVLQPSSSGTVNLSLNSATPAALDPFISYKGLRSLAWNIPQPVHIVVPLNQNLHAVQIPTGQIHLAMRNASEQLDTFLSSKNLLWDPSKGVIGNVEVNITTHLRPASTPSLRMDTLSLELSAAILSSAKHIAVTLNPSSFFRLSNMENVNLRIPTLEGHFPKGLAWTSHTDHQTWELQTAVLALSLPSLSLQGQQWEFQEIVTKDLTIKSTLERWVITGETEVKQVHTQFGAIKIPDSNWGVRFSGNPASLAVQYSGHTLLHPLRIGGQARLDFSQGEAFGTVTLTPIQFAPQALALSQLIQPWPFPEMDVTHGTVSASAEVTVGKVPSTADTPFHLKRLHGIVDCKDIGGFMKPMIMEGLTTRVEILGEGATFRIPPTPLHIRRIHSAVDLTDTSFILSSKTFPQTSAPILSITNAATHLLGGKVSLSEAGIDPSATTHEVTLQVQGLDLGEILRLEQQETVKGTGTLDGALPLFISGSGVEVHHGSLQARSPGGTLQMDISEATASSWAKSQPNLDLIVQSLQNFHYSQLDVGVDYEKNGTLKLTTQLKGKNPDFRKGFPIHFNFNIEENIPALMKSLSLVKGLEDTIEKMMSGRGKSSTK